MGSVRFGSSTSCRIAPKFTASGFNSTMATLWAVPSVGKPRSRTKAWLSSTLRRAAGSDAAVGRVATAAGDDGALVGELAAAPSFLSEHPGIISISKAYRGKNLSFVDWFIMHLQ